MILKHIRQSLMMFIFFFVLLGIVYPVLITALAQVIFKEKANGSLITYDGKIVGSKLICQPINDPRFFWFRPSSTSDFPCNPLSSGGSNLGPTNKQLIKNVKSRIELLKSYDIDGPYPGDMILGSGSGLEPYISIKNAMLQAKRVSKYSGIPYQNIVSLINKYKEPKTFGIFGADKVNVMKLNMELLKWMKKDQHQKAY